MLVLKSAADGGDGTFASVAKICDRLPHSSPDLIPVLLQTDWPFDRYLLARVLYCSSPPLCPVHRLSECKLSRPPDRSLGEEFYKRPVLFLNKDNQTEMIFSRGALIRSPRGRRPASIPKLTKIQCEALDAVHFAAEEVSHKIKYQEGDLLLFNNRRILHGRDAFTDAAEGSQRHMLRFWLKDEAMAGSPPDSALQKVWGNIFSRDVECEGHCEERHWPSVPDPS